MKVELAKPPSNSGTVLNITDTALYFSKFDCSRLDNKDLVERWQARNKAGSFVQTR
jgi:hypothetical protein